jgi:UDP-glucose 4-epimerase
VPPSGQGEALTIFGNDYPTADGTCIRDYIHVTDLAQAHFLALRQLLDGGGSARYNLGNGSGYSNLQVIETAERIAGWKFPTILRPVVRGTRPR